MSMMLGLNLAITNQLGGGGAPAVPGDDWFAELGSTSTWYANSTWPNGIYSSALDKTLQAITDFTVVGGNPIKQVRLYSRDHAGSTWPAAVDLFTDDSNSTGTQPAADDHGVGALCEDHQGLHPCFRRRPQRGDEARIQHHSRQCDELHGSNINRNAFCLSASGSRRLTVEPVHARLRW
jgi:hypothetical protein